METFVALLRGINVGGRNTVRMQALRDLLGDLGLAAVKTYIQSGNVAFQSGGQNAAALAEAIGAAIADVHGFRPQVMVLPLADLQTAVAANPYPEAAADPKSVHLYFLAAAPDEVDWEPLDDVKKESERYQLIDNVFYLHAPEGIGRSKLAAKVEKALGVPVTARNWRSTQKILDMAEATAAKG